MRNMLPERALWVDDHYASRCRSCDACFTLFRRRHHCRNCGQIFCSDCLVTPHATAVGRIITNKITTMVGLGSDGGHKICHECERIVRKRRQVKRPTAKPLAAADALTLPNASDEPVSDTGASHATQDEVCIDAATESSPNKQMPETKDVKDVEPVLSGDDVSMQCSQASPDFDLLVVEECSAHPESAKEREVSYSVGELPMFSRNSMTTWIENLRREAQGRKREEAAKSPKRAAHCSAFKVQPRATLRLLDDPRSPLAALATSFTAPASQEYLRQFEQEVSLHLIKRASRMFVSEGVLPSSDTMQKKEWIAGICDLVWRVLSQTLVVPREHILAHLDVICVPGGSLSETKIIPGVAFLQTVAFRQMKTMVRFPRILLLAGDVGTSMKPLADLTEYIESCEGYLEKQYKRIKLWSPSVIVVEGRMHHYLLDRIQEESNITLILQAGRTVLHRLSRCCNASIIRDLQYVSGMDISDPSVLGTCDLFELLHIGGKNLCTFSGLRVPLFTTVLLRGAEGAQLDGAKRVFVNCASTAYHLTLQVHCFVDLGIRMHFDYIPPMAVDESSDEKMSFLSRSQSITSNLYSHEEYMRFISSSPRAEDRMATLSMNIAIDYPDDVVNMNHKYDKLVTDCLEVGTALLDVSACEDTAGMGAASSTAPNVRQNYESLSFYSDGDETLLEYLSTRAREGDGTRLIVHGAKRIWVTVRGNASGNSSSRATTQPGRVATGLGTAPQGTKLSHLYDPSNGRERNENDACRLPLRTEAICRQCMRDVTHNISTVPTEPCSVHTLNISWGAFLEFLIYSSPSVVMACGHSMRDSSFISFTLFPHTVAEVAVSICSEELPVYDIIPPPMTMPLCPNVVQMYCCEEFEELRHCVTQTIGMLQTVLNPHLSHQLAGANQAKNARQTLSQLLSNRNLTTDAESASNTEERGRVLLKEAENLIVHLSSLSSAESLARVRCGEMADLMMSAQDWFTTYVSQMERRGGKVPSFMEILSLDCNSWALEASRSFCVRVDEPTSFMAVALRAMGIWSDVGDETLENTAGFDIDRTPDIFMDSCPDDGEVVHADDEAQKASVEKTVELVFGIASSKPVEASSVFATIRSVSDALEVLSEEVTGTKTSFKHVINCFYPWDKGEKFRATVEVMFPVHFAALQYLYTDGKVDELMLSLSRCRAFKPQGGKTNSDFFITLDERFLLKQIKQAELVHFAEFGPRYFNQMRKVYSRGTRSGTGTGLAQLGSSLGKILGLFSLHVKGRKRHTESSSDVRFFVLMESIFYSRQTDVMYDLKGSQRNRVAPEGSSVLLDQDLARVLRKGSFFFCSNETKNLFMDSVTCDAHLLATSSIMDYSLIVGVNRIERQLYVGIIDYLHPYTGAKAIESKVKAGLETVLGGQGRDPTIIDPPSYRARFTRWLGDCAFSVPTKTLAVPWVSGKGEHSEDLGNLPSR